MKERTVVFRYRKGNCFLYKIPAPVKLLSLLVFAAAAMLLPLYAACAGIGLLALFAFLCGFTVKEQLADIKPVLFYAFFLYTIGVCTGLYSFFSGSPEPIEAAAIFYPDYDYGFYIARLFLVMQLSALLFRTTTSIEIKEAVCAAETGIRAAIRRIPFTKTVSLKAKLAVSVALMMSFVPALFELWNKLSRAYRARGGKRGLKQIRILFVALIALSLHYAQEKARALAAREIV
jgi:biotin transport system permease protein/energy-coupling factor transport system permease protein